MEREQIPAGLEPEFVTVAQASSITNLGKTKLYELIADGTIKSTKIGKARRLRLRSVI